MVIFTFCVLLMDLDKEDLIVSQSFWKNLTEMPGSYFTSIQNIHKMYMFMYTHIRVLYIFDHFCIKFAHTFHTNLFS